MVQSALPLWRNSVSSFIWLLGDMCHWQPKLRFFTQQLIEDRNSSFTFSWFFGKSCQFRWSFKCIINSIFDSCFPDPIALDTVENNNNRNRFPKRRKNEIRLIDGIVSNWFIHCYIHCFTNHTRAKDFQFQRPYAWGATESIRCFTCRDKSLWWTETNIFDELLANCNPSAVRTQLIM